MTKEFEFRFETIIVGNKIIFVALILNDKNEAMDYINGIEKRAQYSILATIQKMAQFYEFNMRNNQKFSWLHGYEFIGEIKTYKPSHRIFVIPYKLVYKRKIYKFAILLFGTPKRSQKADKRIRTQYKRAEKLKKMLLGEKDELEQKLREILEKVGI